MHQKKAWVRGLLGSFNKNRKQSESSSVCFLEVKDEKIDFVDNDIELFNYLCIV